MAKRLLTPTALMVVVMMLVVACGSATTSSAPPASEEASTPPAPSASAEESASAEPVPTEAPAAAVPAVPTGYAELDQALGADQPFAGKTVSIQTQWIGGEGENFAASVADFAAATGIQIQIDSIGSSHETVLRTRISGGQPPDLAMLAQPTPVLAYAADGKVIDVATFMDAAKLNAEHAATIGLVTQGSNIWGIPYKADAKSLIWYPIKAFEAKGYAVPTTWDELIALSDKIVADGSAPWCISAGGPGDATGWQITDWVEEVVLKTKGLDVYNQWISHDIPFSDPQIKDVFDNYVGKIFFTDGYVFGGPTAIVATAQTTTMDPMFNEDLASPQCWMQKIPTWYGPDFFPDQRATSEPSKYIIGEDVGMFPFPTIDPAHANVEGSADTLMVLLDRPEVRAVAQFLATPEGIQRWIEAGSAISANTATPAAWYEGSYKLKVASEVTNNAAGIGFDASDLMPGAVGAGTFWTQSVDWVNNNGANTDAVLQAIDASWP
ncbi:MAG: carbohydrate ABC transporter substrate-binding protein [Phycisphaerae bacterium]|nr:carbohydrate ABC transporter substrate-binding protein [Phycisphaerae bacterium]